ncbi:MAG: triose-phosphate isomerase [Gammaproteobacteria bacterium]|jgi:triosephosphate isomerase|nr:triose-phosphate isomerase [Gammaproteobacteria bacterium]
MRKPLVAGNWKMNGSLASARDLAAGISAGAAGLQGVDVVVCPAFVHLDAVQSVIAAAGTVALGAQDISTREDGAYTGEVSAAMLKDIGCRYVLVGHSERRALHGESDSEVAHKFMKAQEKGLIPVLCVGETLEERKAQRTLQVVAAQFNAVADLAGIEALSAAVVAYEPVWAIGTGETASPEQAQEVHAALRALAAKRSAKIASGLRLLYGGSVKPANAAELFAMPDIDGGLIGGAALDAAGFLAICSAAAA